MSTSKILTLAALGAVGAYAVLNTVAKPGKGHRIADEVRQELSYYNDSVHPEQDRRATLMDRTKIMHDVKDRKPWNMTYAEKQRLPVERKE